MNIIFFMTDTYRRDNLSCYGPTQVKTPRLIGLPRPPTSSTTRTWVLFRPSRIVLTS